MGCVLLKKSIQNPEKRRVDWKWLIINNYWLYYQWLPTQIWVNQTILSVVNIFFIKWTWKPVTANTANISKNWYPEYLFKNSIIVLLFTLSIIEFLRSRSVTSTILIPNIYVFHKCKWRFSLLYRFAIWFDYSKFG